MGGGEELCWGLKKKLYCKKTPLDLNAKILVYNTVSRKDFLPYSPVGMNSKVSPFH